jgi:hypothetical protein
VCCRRACSFVCFPPTVSPTARATVGANLAELARLGGVRCLAARGHGGGLGRGGRVVTRHAFEFEALVKRVVKHLKVLDHARRERFTREGGAEAVACRVLGVGREGEVDDGSDRYDDLMGGRGEVKREREQRRERERGQGSESEIERASERVRERASERVSPAETWSWAHGVFHRRSAYKKQWSTRARA